MVSALLVFPAIVAGVVFATLPADDSAGLDFEVTGPGIVPRVFAVLLAMGSAVLPFLTARWARKRWAGYLLLGCTLSVVAFIVGLVLQGIL